MKLSTKSFLSIYLCLEIPKDFNDFPIKFTHHHPKKTHSWNFPVRRIPNYFPYTVSTHCQHILTVVWAVLAPWTTVVLLLGNKSHPLVHRTNIHHSFVNQTFCILFSESHGRICEREHTQHLVYPASNHITSRITLFFLITFLRQVFAYLSWTRVRLCGRYFQNNFPICFHHLKDIFNWVAKVIPECFGFALLRYVIGPENSRHSLNQSDTKLNPITTWLPAFSRALVSLVGFT